MIVSITASDAALAIALGRKRQADNLAAGRTDYNGANVRSGEVLHVIGCLGELAAARALRLPFDPVERGLYGAERDDLANGLEIRTRGSFTYDRMFVHPKDRPGLVYVHAKLLAPIRDGDSYVWRHRQVAVVGWITGERAAELAELRDYGTPNWTVHERHLQSITTCPFCQ